MEHRRRVVIAAAATVGLFVLVQLGALALIEPFQTAGLQPVEDPDDPTNSLLYVVAILVATALMLAAFKFEFQWAVRGGVVFASAFLSWYVLVVVLPPWIVVGGLHVPATLGALAIGAGLLVYPEWYVIDAAGVLMGAGAAGLFGISFGLLPAIVLLVVLAVYDAISVYGTEHMLSLAEGALDVKIPVVLIVPVTLSYSFLDDEPDGGEDVAAESAESNEDVSPDDDESDPSRRDALFIGLGDAVIPTVLVASAAFFAPVDPLGAPGFALNPPALGAMLGTLCGLVVLLWMVLQGRAHAGLPLLNGGAIGGYLVGALASGLTIAQALGIPL